MPNNKLTQIAKTEYDVVWTAVLDVLVAEVNTLASAGWIPTGGIAVLPVDDGRRYYQAIVRVVAT